MGEDFTLVEVCDVWAAPGFLIRRCHQIATGIFLEEAKAEDLTPVQFAALAFVHFEPEIDQRTLGEMIALDRSSVTKCIDRLERRGFIHRKVSPSDKRARLLTLTPLGASALSDVSKAANRTRTRIETSFGAEKLAQLSTLLAEFADALNSTSRAPLTSQA
ncbi:MarR family winged helix-turn-helix transcriptional regulator [Rhizobium sp. S152]|uniref:MarR family winged helix-turn-helix transcriptional regulator n=1 Tax=Rhizobium sp. S152 TaxID=3055038 RepID=UPI003FA7566C